MRIVDNKKLISVFLSLSMALSLCPVASFADIDPGNDGSFSVDVPMDSQLSDIGDMVLPDEALNATFDDYIDHVLYESDGVELYSGAGDNTLNDSNKYLYMQLETAIKSISSGRQTSTIIDLDWKPEDAPSWTSSTLVSELGLSPNDPAVTQGETTKTLMSAIQDNLDRYIDLNALVVCLLDNLPYDLFWFSKTEGVHLSYYIHSDLSNGISFQVVDPSIKFVVAKEYADPSDPERYTVNPSIAAASSSVSLASRNAKAVVDRHAGLSDGKKLLAYKDEICNLVSYDNDAAQSSSSLYNSNAWQLIWVFDNDPSTNVVCEGYSKAFQYLCDLSVFKTDVKARMVTGKLMGSGIPGDHMWNLVDIGGSTYIADITNSDAGTVGSSGQLFLTGTPTGSVNSAYTFRIGGSTVGYAYDKDTLAAYTAQELTLSTSSYDFDSDTSDKDDDSSNPGQTPGDPDTKPSNPSTPSEPSNPTDPSDPSNPSNPGNPSNPNNPSNPGNPSNPSNPNQPSNPTNPSDIYPGTLISSSTETLSDGTKAVTYIYSDGAKVVEETSPDGQFTRTSSLPNGTHVVESQKTEIPVTVQIPYLIENEIVTLPISKIYPELFVPSFFIPSPLIYFESARATRVKVPVDSPYSNTTAVIIDDDGNIKAIPKSISGDDYVVFEVPGGNSKIAIVDSSVSFPDVDPSSWYSKEGVVNFAASRGLITGVEQQDGSYRFDGDSPMTRAMFATVLHRLESRIYTENQAPFNDVADNEWYSEAVSWASQTGIIRGYEGTNNFGPNDYITREQLALMLGRYAIWLGMDFDELADLSNYADADALTYGRDAMQWAVASNIINGYGGTSYLAPTATATRAEIGAVLMRFILLALN